ncbi:hypothetical protein [Nonomuraea sp. NPDC049141]|uniref:hypothetical protein n=1 Tax=Nonomuraea sp. NPDC049141 TaxID=3155500 RepID=UPI0033F7455B
MTTSTTPPDLYRERAWRAFDRITAADEAPDPALGWDQAAFRTECGTGCCYAGHLALDNDGTWLVTIRPEGMFIDGKPIDPNADEDTDYSVWEYLVAEDDDPESAIEEAFGKRVIHVGYRAERLLGLLDVTHELFAGLNTRPFLEELINRRFGPRLPSVGGTAI